MDFRAEANKWSGGYHRRHDRATRFACPIVSSLVPIPIAVPHAYVYTYIYWKLGPLSIREAILSSITPSPSSSPLEITVNGQNSTNEKVRPIKLRFKLIGIYYLIIQHIFLLNKISSSSTIEWEKKKRKKISRFKEFYLE